MGPLNSFFCLTFGVHFTLRWRFSVCRRWCAEKEKRVPGIGSALLLYYIGNYSIGSDLVAGEPGDAVKALLQVGIGGDVVAHLAIVELLIGHHVKVAGAGQAKDDGLFLAGLLALEGLVDGGADGVAALGGGQDALSLVWLDFITSLS